MHLKGHHQENAKVPHRMGIFQNIYLIRELHLEGIKKPYNSEIKRQVTQFKKQMMGMNRHFTKEEKQMINKHSKKMLNIIIL